MGTPEKISFDVDAELKRMQVEGVDSATAETSDGGDTEVHTTPVEPPVAPANSAQQKDRWKNRRKMAWLALLSMLAVIFLFLTPLIAIERIEALGGVMGWFFGTMTAIVGSYMGFATYYHLKDDQNKRLAGG